MATSGEAVPPTAVPPVPLGVEIPPEPPDIGARALYIAARLLAGATTFFFLAFVFAYFYLRSLNQNGMWRPPHINPDQGLGVAILVCVVVSALLAQLAARRMAGQRSGWMAPATIAIVLGLAAVVLQAVEYGKIHWGPTDGAYASVYVAWTALYMVAVLGTMYWLETQVATEARARRSPAGKEGDIREADRLIAPGLSAAAFFWAYLAAIGAIAYIVLYLL
jgi:heme/copper-type cytochrome/quinol oxidase subunit 3